MTLTADTAALMRLGVLLAVTFGSRARGIHGPQSDLDVGVWLGSTSDVRLDRLDAVRAALHASLEVDLVVLDLADPLLLYEVAVDGRPVFESRPGTWEEFRILAVKRYYDTAWIRDLEEAALRDRLADGPT